MRENQDSTVFQTEDTPTTKEQSGLILEKISEFHGIIKKYSSIKSDDKPLIVGAILLALKSTEYTSFSIESLTGDHNIPDGEKIFQAVESYLENIQQLLERQRKIILNQLSIVKNIPQLNEILDSLEKTPLRFFAEYLQKNLFKSVVQSESPDDFFGLLYGTLGNDGNILGIVLTPMHIRELFCEILDLQPTDIVLDPCTGTGGFLVTAMHYMLKKAYDKEETENIRQKQLFGVEIQPYMTTISFISMILRGAQGNNIYDTNFMQENISTFQEIKASVGMMNPPYSQGSKDSPELYEISFIKQLLDSLIPGGRAAVIVPQSTMVGKTNSEKDIKSNILKKHTLEGVISLNQNTFWGVGTMPCIAVFTAGKPHPQKKECKFIDFRNDGFKIKQNVGIVPTEFAFERRKYLLDVWFDRLEVGTKFCIKTPVEQDDEWLHAFYFFDDSIPTDDDFEKVINNYLTFELSMILQNREYLFDYVAGKE